jgi:TfoX/Sxy family transcriptional regulator of competence genes
MAFDEGLAQRIREHLATTDDVVEKRMFGGLAFMVAGNMCVGVIGEDLIARVGPDAGAADRLPGGGPMAFTGRPMKGWTQVDHGVLDADATLAVWIDAALAHVRTLPAK